MKTRAKIGNKPGNPAYRTSSVFRYQKDLTIIRNKSKINKLPENLKHKFKDDF